MSPALGVHVGQQNMTMPEMRKLWKDLDEAQGRLDFRLGSFLRSTTG